MRGGQLLGFDANSLASQPSRAPQTSQMQIQREMQIQIDDTSLFVGLFVCVCVWPVGAGA